VLMGENIVFDFATKFTQEHPEIESPQEFKISNKIYKDFENYVLKQDFEYKTATQEYLEELKKIAEDEGYDQEINGEFDALHEVVKASKQKDLQLFEGQIKELLANEIVSRYYFQEGRVLNSFQHDKALKKAIKVLSDNTLYESILTP
ncbi:MAG TPA: hypothetical protein VFD80_03825, partial [Flavobacteriaceae bacterium]|nr:hypothetical protein [Flavobacteriaceae bacterium]